MKKYIYKQKTLRGDDVYFMDKKAREDLTTFSETLNEHVEDKNNPHEVTLSQVLGNDEGIVPIKNGGTNANNAADARKNLGLDKFAGSASAGGAANSVANPVTFSASNGDAAGSTYDGSSALMVSPTTIGAVPLNGDSKIVGNVTVQGIVNATYLRKDNNAVAYVESWDGTTLKLRS